MATQYILQPNGLWAAYSTVTDCLEGFDFTETEIIEEVVEDCRKRAVADIKKYLERRKAGELTEFSVEWEEAVRETEKHCEDKEFVEEVKRINKLMSSSEVVQHG